MIRNYFKIAWRNIVRHKIFTFINVLGLATGICICLVIYGIASFEYSFDTFHPDKERVYRLVAETVENTGDKGGRDQIPAPIPVAGHASLPGLQEMVAYIPYPAKIAIGGGGHAVFDNKLINSWGVSSILTGAAWFNIFKYDWLAGNAAGALSRPFQLVITESRARLYFGWLTLDKMIGRQVIFNDSLRLTVSGIVKDWNKNTDFPYTEFISIGTIDNSFLKKDLNLTDWGNEHGGHDTRALVKLAPGASPAAVDRQLAGLIGRNMKIDSGTSFRVRLQALADVHFNASIDDGRRKAHLPTMYGLEAIAVFILLIAAINFINLSTAMSIRRAKEIGIRKVLGSKRADLIFQFLAETLILTFFSLCLALLFVQPVLGAFHSFLPDGIRFHFGSPATMSFVLCLLLVTALLAGLYPAKVLSSYEPVVVLKGGDVHLGGRKGYLRKGLIVFQFTVSLVFIIGVLVVRDQINYIRNKDLGFESHAVVSIDTDWQDSLSKVSLLAEEIKHVPGVEQVALQSFPPLTPIYTGLTVQYKGKTPIEVPGVVQCGDEHFIALYKMKLLAGRNYRNSNEYVINETCAKALGFADARAAIGQIIGIAGDHPIVGVVADFHEKSLREVIKPVVFLNIQPGMRNIAVKLAGSGGQAGSLSSTLGQIEKEWKSVYPGQPFVYSFLDESIAAMYTQERKTAILISVAMFLTIFISCMGLLGLSMFNAQQRTREIGIRKVLGASVANIMALLSRDFVVLVALAFAIASPVAWYFMNEWLQGFAYRIFIGWWIFGLAGFGAVSVALLTVGFHSFKAAVANPVKSLRTV